MKTDYESPLEHSSSPWRAMAIGETGNWIVDCERNGLISRIATLNADLLCPEHSGTVEANARLIAAAPELLAACKAVRDGWEKNLTEPMRLINEAIAAAEGKP